MSLPGGVFSTAGVGVKTNLLFFTKGKKTERIWYYDLSHVKVDRDTRKPLEILDAIALHGQTVALALQKLRSLTI